MKRLRFGLIIVFLTVVAACSEDLERVALPPDAPMDGINRLAVIGVDNYTSDPSIGRHFEQIVTSILRESEVYDVVDAITARAVMARLGITFQEVAHPAVAIDLAEHLEVDALIIGSANYFFEDNRISPPQCTYCDIQDRSPFWSAIQTTTVLATFEAKVLRATDGKEIWVNAVEGRDTTNRIIDLAWKQSGPPPVSLLPHPNRGDIPQTRETAIRQAAREFTVDLLPRYTWVRKEETEDPQEAGSTN